MRDGHPSEHGYDVWRRLPGTQGENDCWSREGRNVEADTAADAIDKVAVDLPDHLLRTDFFAVLSTNATVYFIRPERDEPARRLVFMESSSGL